MLHKFYTSKKWRDLAHMLKIKSGGICARCGDVFDTSHLRAHHKEELTLNNLDDLTISLNQNNIEILCHDCHNREHKRFGFSGKREVYLVWGAPCSGKSAYVRDEATRHDLIVDLDRIHTAIADYDFYDRPNSTKAEVFAIRDLLLNRIRYRAGHWERAFIVGGYPDRTKREQIIRDYQAIDIYITATKEECISRIDKDIARLAIRDTVISWINTWFDRLTI